MGTQKLSDGVKRKIEGWELVGEKYAGEDFNLGDETILNLFYDRTNARLNIVFSLNYGDPDCEEDPEQDVLLVRCYGVEVFSCHITPGNDYINAIRYKDYGDVVEWIIDCAGMSFTAQRVVVTKQPWSMAIQQLTSRGEYYGE